MASVNKFALKSRHKFWTSTPASWSRGRLVQWENVRLPIQRSKFASRLRQLIFLSRPWQKLYATPINSNFSSAAKIEQCHLLERKAVFNSLLYEKGNVPTNWSYDVTFARGGQWRHNNLLRNSTTTLATWGGISKHLTDKSTAESLEMTE